MITGIVIASVAFVAAKTTGSGDIITYAVENIEAPVSTDRYYFIEKDDAGLVADALGNTVSGDEMNPAVFHDYSITLSDGVVGMSFNNMSVPVNVSVTAQKWKYADITCSSHPDARAADGMTLLVVCDVHQTTEDDGVVFRYRVGKGITGFYAPCFVAPIQCWFQLKGEKALLGSPPALGHLKSARAP